MADNAQVRSLEDLEAVRAALAEFEEEARGVLGGIEMELRRAVTWLKQDRWSHWQGQIKRSREEMAGARTQLARKRISSAHGTPKDTLEKEMVRDAQRKLREAEEKLELIRRWVPKVEHAIGEYRGQSRPLEDLISGDIPKALASLKRMIDALAAYSAIAPPPRVAEPEGPPREEAPGGGATS